MKISTLRSLLRRTEFSDINRHFADFMLKLSRTQDPDFYLACGLVSHQAEQGDVCLNLSEYSGTGPVAFPGAQSDSVPAPPLAEWIESLQNNPLVGKPGEKKPLILDTQGSTPRLYLYRYWQYENILGQYIRQSSRRQPISLDRDLFEAGLARLFPSVPGEVDDQVLAARAALENRFCVISGGPGTGKTTTVLKIIILLLEQAGENPFELALVAPTGKAANRLRESILVSREQAERAEFTRKELLNAIPDETSTIHRMLGAIRNSPRFKYNIQNPLPFDCVIVDEVSMVDLALMSKLVQALKPDCRLILLGDKNQLSSVESGSVLGDICSTPENQAGKPSELARCMINLSKSYRFTDKSSIGRLSRLINEGCAAEAAAMLESPPSANISWHQSPLPRDIRESLKNSLKKIYSSFSGQQSVENSFEMVSRFNIICALRSGPYGTVTLNRLIEQILMDEKIVTGDQEWYPGRRIMITRNDYHLELYNGDIGIALPDREDGNRLKVYFERGKNHYQKCAPARLPEHESAFAMTIHKSQGSEFDSVLIILPNQDTPVLSRELIYTAITRARKKIQIWGDMGVLVKALNRTTRRSSGLKDMLHGGNPTETV